MSNTTGNFTDAFRTALKISLEKEAEKVLQAARKEFERRARGVVAEFSLDYARTAEISYTGEHELSFTLKIDPRRVLDGRKP